MGDGISRRDALGGLAAALGIAAGGPLAMGAEASAPVSQAARMTGWMISCDGLASYSAFGLQLVRCEDGSFRLISTLMLPQEWRELAGVGARVSTSVLSERRRSVPVAVADVFSLEGPDSPHTISAREAVDRRGWSNRHWTDRRVIEISEDGPVLALIHERIAQYADPIELDRMTPSRFPALRSLRGVHVNDIIKISWGHGWDRAILYNAVPAGENIPPPWKSLKGATLEEARHRVRVLEKQVARGLNPTAKAIARAINHPTLSAAG